MNKQCNIYRTFFRFNNYKSIELLLMVSSSNSKSNNFHQTIIKPSRANIFFDRLLQTPTYLKKLTNLQGLLMKEAEKEGLVYPRNPIPRK